MSRMIRIVLLFFALSAWALAGAASLIAEWDFSHPDVLKGKYPLDLLGNSGIKNGALEIRNPDERKPSGAATQKIFRELTPENAFSLVIEFELDTDPEARPDKRTAILFDNKYIAYPNEAQAKYHSGMQIGLDRNGSAGSIHYTPFAVFGINNQSVRAGGLEIKLPPGKHTLKVFFSATGKVQFIFDGNNAGSVAVPPGALTAACNGAAIGNRCGSNYQPLGGRICKVQLFKEEFKPLSIAADQNFRHVFERDEKPVALHVQLYNAADKATGNLKFEAKLPDGKLFSLPVASVGAKTVLPIVIPLPEWLLPGDYEIETAVKNSSGKVLVREKMPCSIVPVYGDFMPVVLWGGSDIASVRDIGFTHQQVGIYPERGNIPETRKLEIIQELDEALKRGLYSYTTMQTLYRFVRPERYLQTDRNGKPYPRTGVDPTHPEVIREFVAVAEEMGDKMGYHPGWDMTLLNSEVRGSTNISYSGRQFENFKRDNGFEVPASVSGIYPAGYESIDGFPWTRIVDDQSPEMVFYRWFWKKGDGWNDLQTALSGALHRKIKHHHTTFYDPAVRVPTVWGSGGNVDMLSQWSYTNPDPIKIGQATDETIAMAQGRPGQKVAAMTQAIWYRSNSSPGSEIKNPPEWMKREANAEYITIPPDCLREALWTKLARRLDAIMYHGSGSLISPEAGAYRFTNPESREVLKAELAKVVVPLGPVLKKVPERMPEVAILETFTGTLYSQQYFPMGWSIRWAADLHIALQWAHIQAAVLFDEHLLNEVNTANLKVLFVPGAEVINADVLAAIVRLQKRGVIVIGDELSAPGLPVDWRIQSFSRTSDPEKDKAALQKLGREIAAVLKEMWQSPLASDNQDFVLYHRGTEDADYLFVINDKRTYGDYIGQWKRVMEKGVPNSGKVSVAFPAKAAYDLVAHQPVALQEVDGKKVFQTSLGPGAGQLVLLLKEPIAAVKVNAPANAVKRGAAYGLSVAIESAARMPVKAILPVEVTLLDSRGTKLPDSGFYACPDGKLAISGVAAPNMAAGAVQVEVKCLASGLTGQATFTVQP